MVHWSRHSSTPPFRRFSYRQRICLGFGGPWQPAPRGTDAWAAEAMGCSPRGARTLLLQLLSCVSAVAVFSFQLIGPPNAGSPICMPGGLMPLALRRPSSRYCFSWCRLEARQDRPSYSCIEYPAYRKWNVCDGGDDMAEGGLVRFEDVDGIGVITVDNPPVNGLSPGGPGGMVRNAET